MTREMKRPKKEDYKTNSPIVYDVVVAQDNFIKDNGKYIDSIENQNSELREKYEEAVKLLKSTSNWIGDNDILLNGVLKFLKENEL